MLTFRNDRRLRDNVLAQMQVHAAQGLLTPVQLPNGPISLYGLGCPHPDEIASVAQALGLPPLMLGLGFALFDGFPETLDERKAFAATRRRMLAAFPVGVDCSGAAGQFFHRLLKEGRYHIADRFRTAASASLLREVISALEIDPLGAFLDAELRARVHDESARQIERIRHLWQIEHRQDRALEETRRALEMLEAVCDLPINLYSPAQAAELSADHAQAATIELWSQWEDLLRDLFIRVLKWTARTSGPIQPGISCF